MIRIAFVISTISTPTAGTEKQLLNIIRHLDRGRFAPILCVIHSSDWLKKEFDLCPLYDVGITSYKNIRAIPRFLRFIFLLRRERIDIVHTLFKDGMRIGIPAGRLAGINSVVAVRRSQGYWMKPFDLSVTRFLNRMTNLILANSYNTRQWVTEVEGYPADKIRVIHNALDLKAFGEVHENARAMMRLSLNIPPDVPVIGIVANLRPVKAIDIFLRSAALVRKTTPGAHFVIVGEGDQETTLKRLAAELGIGDCTHFIGSRRDIPEVLSGLDIGVLSSSSESFSNAILEYMAAGLPVVCTDVGGAREAIEDASNGYVVAPGDYLAMADFIARIINCGEMQAMGERNRRKAGKLFSLPAIMQHYEALYEELAAPAR